MSGGRTLLCAVLVVVGLGMVVSGVRDRSDAEGSRSWPTVPGTITESRLDTEYRSDRPELYHPVIEYTFAVDGAERSGTRVALGPLDTNDRNRMQAIVDRYRVGQEVSVAYDPSDPASTVLEVGNAGTSGSAIWAGAVLAIAGLGLALVFRRSARRGRGPENTPPTSTDGGPAPSTE